MARCSNTKTMLGTASVLSPKKGTGSEQCVHERDCAQQVMSLHCVEEVMSLRRARRWVRDFPTRVDNSSSTRAVAESQKRAEAVRRLHGGRADGWVAHATIIYS